jgi:hypothetical protein
VPGVEVYKCLFVLSVEKCAQVPICPLTASKTLMHSSSSCKTTLERKARGVFENVSGLPGSFTYKETSVGKLLIPVVTSSSRTTPESPAFWLQVAPYEQSGY